MNEKDLYVIKIGTNALIDETGEVRKGLVQEVLNSAKKIIDDGNYALVVTSGAVRIGRTYLKDNTTPKKIAASVGQPLLFNYYREEANKFGITISEILLTKPYIAKREQFLNLQITFNELFEKGILPIVNENDVLVSGSGWSFNGNDPLACDLAISLQAHKLFLISDVDGLYDCNPLKNPDAKFIPEVDNITDAFLKYCSNDVSENSTGGMISKLKVARIASAVGIETQIVNGLKPGNIERALGGEKIGTIFNARQIHEKISNRDRWILVATNSTGSIEVDDGAVTALRAGKSLLAVGVKKVYGQFKVGEVIEIIDQKKHGIAFGIIDLSFDEIGPIVGTKDAQQVQVIHSNNMFILK